jgi:hypothetical protein
MMTVRRAPAALVIATIGCLVAGSIPAGSKAVATSPGTTDPLTGRTNLETTADEPTKSLLYLPYASRHHEIGAWPVTLQSVGQLGGPSRAVASDGLRALLGMGSTVLALDITVYERPKELAHSDPLPGLVLGIAVAGDYAYVAAGAAGLAVMDIGNTVSIETVSVSATPDWAFGVCVAGRYAYVAAGDAGLRVFDVIDPVHPKEIAILAVGSSARWITVADGYAYIGRNSPSNQTADVAVADVRDPTGPRLVSSLQWPATDAAVAGSYAYVVDPGSGLTVFDVSNPVSPRLIDPAPALQAQAYQIALAGHYAYLGGDGELFTVDVSNPAAVVLKGSTGRAGQAVDMVVADDVAYVAVNRAPDIPIGPQAETALLQGVGGLWEVEVSRPSSPITLSNYEPPRSIGGDVGPYDIVPSGNYAYVVGSTPDAQGTVWTLDVRDPALPRIADVAITRDQGLTADLALEGRYLYAAGEKLIVLDVVEAAHPQPVGTLALWSPARCLAVSGSRAYSADFGGRLHTIDVSDPVHPRDLGAVPSGIRADSLTIVGTRLYTIDHNALVVADACIQASCPHQLSRVEFGIDPSVTGGKIAVSGDYAYIAYDPDTLLVVDVNDPAAPRQVASLDLQSPSSPPMRVTSVLVRDNLVYVSAWGVTVVNVAAPAKPAVVGHFVAPAYVTESDVQTARIALVGSYVYTPFTVLQRGEQGIAVLRIGSQ